jgi:hypothetical protein
VVSPRKLDRQLCLAYAAKTTQDMYALSTILLMFRQQCAFKLRHLCRPIYELTRFRDALEAEDGSILSKVYKCFSYAP